MATSPTFDELSGAIKRYEEYLRACPYRTPVPQTGQEILYPPKGRDRVLIQRDKGVLRVVVWNGDEFVLADRAPVDLKILVVESLPALDNRMKGIREKQEAEARRVLDLFNQVFPQVLDTCSRLAKEGE